MNLSIKSHPSPNFDPYPIPVEFVVLHYTACSAERALSILCDKAKKVSSHLVLDTDGTLFELVSCLNDKVERAWHSGASRIFADGKMWEGLNDCAIGIEIVNLNGNVFPYPDEQYRVLGQILSTFKERFPALRDPSRIVGHEEVAGWRGKVDPGRCFDWNRIYKDVYPERTDYPEKLSALPATLVKPLQGILKFAPKEGGGARRFLF